MWNLRTLIIEVEKFIMPRNNSQLMTSAPIYIESNTITAHSPLPSQMKENQIWMIQNSYTKSRRQLEQFPSLLRLIWSIAYDWSVPAYISVDLPDSKI